MMPQQTPFYSPAPASGASPGYGQPGFLAANPAPQAQGLVVQVGVPVFASTAQQVLSNGGNAVVGNMPLSANNQQSHQHGRRPSPPPSSFPPGFEPGHNKNVAMGIPSQPVPYGKGTGELVARPNDHHVSYQHHHRHANHHEYQHQQQYQHHSEQLNLESQHLYRDEQPENRHRQHQQQLHSKQRQHLPEQQHRQQNPQRHQPQHEFQHPHQNQQHLTHPQSHPHPHPHPQSHPHPHPQSHPHQHQHQQQQKQQHQHQHPHPHPHQHQDQHQDQHQHQQHLIQPHPHPHQRQHLPQHQHQHPHQRQHQPQHHSPQHQHQHQHHLQQQDHQQHLIQPHPHPHQHQHQHQPQHHSPQHQHQHRHQHQHHLQQQDHYQPQHNQYPQQAHSQLQVQAQQNQNPHPQLQLQTYPQPVQLQTQPEPQLQTQPQPVQLQTQPQSLQFQTWPQIQPQAQSAVQQVQFIPAPFPSSLHAYPPNIQAGIENGVAIGLPVMPTPSNTDSAAPQNFAQIQQPTQAWQPGLPETSSLSQQQGNFSQIVTPKKDHYLNDWQSVNLHREDYSKAEKQTDISREHVQGMPPAKVKSGSCVEGRKPLHAPRNSPPMQSLHGSRSSPPMEPLHAPRSSPSMQSNHHFSSRGSHRSSFFENNHRQWNSPPKLQTPARANGRNPHHGFQSHSNGHGKFHMNGYNNGSQVSSSQRWGDSRGKPFNRDMQRSDMEPMRCDPCDRTFTTSEILATHVKTHVKCGEEGCTFEASGKIVKEHKVTEHGKIEVQATNRGRRALALRSMEDKEDIRRWREERKKSYPTSANLLRKAEERRRREVEGDFVDEDSEKRCQRLRDVVAKQKQLGFQVPEIPSHYFRLRRHDRQPREMIREETAMAEDTKGKSGMVKSDRITGTKRAAEDMEASQEDIEHDRPKNESVDMERLNYDAGPPRRGRQRRFTQRQEGRKRHQKYDNTQSARAPRPLTLLSKLLHDDVEKESSCLLQCCRFMVNNSFFLQGPSPASLKHFEWIMEEAETEHESGPSATRVLARSVDPLPARVIDSKAEEEGVRACLDPAISTSGKDSVSDAENQASADGGEMQAVGETDDAPHALANVNTSVPAWKPGDASARLPYTEDAEAGEVVSGHSESAVEDEDISQFMNLEVNGADSGCCFD